LPGAPAAADEKPIKPDRTSTFKTGQNKYPLPSSTPSATSSLMALAFNLIAVVSAADCSHFPAADYCDEIWACFRPGRHDQVFGKSFGNFNQRKLKRKRRASISPRRNVQVMKVKTSQYYAILSYTLSALLCVLSAAISIPAVIVCPIHCRLHIYFIAGIANGNQTTPQLLTHVNCQ